MRHHPSALACALVLSAFAPSLPAVAASWSLRVEGGSALTADTTFRDPDCGQRTPPALFGCGAGRDGRPLGARGGFGDSPSYTLAVGWQWHPAWRSELAVSSLPDLGFTGEANFPGVAGEEPVSADLRSTAALALLYWDFGRTFAIAGERWQPFVGAGLGAARNQLDRMLYRFPGLGAQAITLTPDGTTTNLAWQAAAGVGYRCAPRLTLDFAYRYSDLGPVTTDAGSALIVRTRGARSLTIAGTEGRLGTHALTVGLRYSFAGS
jgi:opacity protein-like surface antigen